MLNAAGYARFHYSSTTLPLSPLSVAGRNRVHSVSTNAAPLASCFDCYADHHYSHRYMSSCGENSASFGNTTSCTPCGSRIVNGDGSQCVVSAAVIRPLHGCITFPLLLAVLLALWVVVGCCCCCCCGLLSFFRVAPLATAYPGALAPSAVKAITQRKVK